MRITASYASGKMVRIATSAGGSDRGFCGIKRDPSRWLVFELPLAARVAVRDRRGDRLHLSARLKAGRGKDINILDEAHASTLSYVNRDRRRRLVVRRRVRRNDARPESRYSRSSANFKGQIIG